ncbi:MAG: DUF2868 domain-containing protein [Puniceicoccaceae bacterium]
MTREANKQTEEGRERVRSERHSWRVEDLVELEALLDHEGLLSPAAIEERDKELAQAVRDRVGGRSERKHRLLAWFEEVRGTGGETGAGKVFEDALTWMRWVLILGGLLAGGIAAKQLLHYEGTTPVNVTGFVFLLILLQLVFLVLSLGLLFYSGVRNRSVLEKEGRGQERFGLVRWLFGGIWQRLERWQRRGKTGTGATPEKRSTAALWRRINREHGELVRLEIGGLQQLFGVAFNFGALLALLLVLLVTDRAFGWQSTLVEEVRSFHRLVEWIAWPWASIWPGAVPTLEEVAGSRIVLKDGMSGLASDNLVSWWQFLTAALLVYGLLPRVGLWVLIQLLLRRKLKLVEFDGLRYEELDDRIQSLVRQAVDGEEVAEGIWWRGEVSGKDRSNQSSAGATGFERPKGILVYEGIETGSGLEQIQEAAEMIAGRPLERVADLEEFLQGPGGDPFVALVLESWLAPVEEDLERCRRLRNHLAKDAAIYLLLQPSEAEQAPTEHDRLMWTRFLNQLGDPGLVIRSMVREGVSS